MLRPPRFVVCSEVVMNLFNVRFDKLVLRGKGVNWMREIEEKIGNRIKA